MTQRGSVVRPMGVVWKSAACVGVLAATSAVAANGLPAWEVSLFTRLHQVPRFVDFALWPPMQLGSAWAPPAVAATAWWLTRSWRPTAGALVAGWGGWWLAKGLKAGIDRGRPYELLGPDVMRPTAPHEGLGFVSGHATVAFACAAILSPYLSKRWRVVGYGLAGTVALSRVVVGAHFPLDVVGGAALGLLLAYLWHLAVGIPVTASAQSEVRTR